MSDTWEDLGGHNPGTPVKITRPPNKPHAGECSHADGHCCPWLNELDRDGHVQRCNCKAEV